MKWMRNKIKITFGLFDIDDLQIGGHCGCCGKWLPKKILPKEWSWSICQKCIDLSK